VRRPTLIAERRRRRALLIPAWKGQQLRLAELLRNLGPPDRIVGRIDHGILFYRADWLEVGRWGCYGFMLCVEHARIISIGTNLTVYAFHQWPTWERWEERRHAPHGLPIDAHGFQPGTSCTRWMRNRSSHE